MKQSNHHVLRLASIGDAPMCNDDWRARDDEQLMQGIRNGHQDALQALYDRYAARVLNLCRRITDREDLADEAALETFWELWQRPERFDAQRATPLTYLLMLARCRSIDLLRTETAHHERSRRLADDSPNPAAPLRDYNGESGQSPKIDKEPDLHGALDELAPKCRDALQLCVVNGLTARQAATAIGVPLGTMKSRIRKGLIQMRQLLRTH